MLSEHMWSRTVEMSGDDKGLQREAQAHAVAQQGV